MEARPFLPLRLLRQAARISAALATLLGIAVLVGWGTGIAALRNLFSTSAAMPPGAALLLVVSGAGAGWLASGRPAARGRRAARGMGAVAAATALMVLVPRALGVSPGWSAFLAPAPALAFLLLGVALLVHDLETRRFLGCPSQFLALVAMLVPLQGLIAHAFGIQPLTDPGSQGSLTWHTAVGLSLLAATLILDRPGSGFVRVFVGPGLAGSLARPVAAASILLPIALGWLFLVAERHLGHDLAIRGASWVVIAAVATGGLVAWWNAAVLSRTERERTHAEATEREQRERLRTTLASIGDGVIATDTLAQVTLVNDVAEALTGWTEAEAKGRLIGEVLVALQASSRERLRLLDERIFRQGEAVWLPHGLLLQSRDGRERPVEGSAAPMQDQDGVIRGAVIVFRDITRQRRLEAERAKLLASEQAARADAERASRAKDEFIATVSHELRTPLNAVLGWSRLLRLGKLDREATARAIEAIERNANTQAQIVDDLLDVSRIVRGELRLDVRAVELSPIIEAAIETMRPAAQARNTPITAVLSSRAGTVNGDPGRLQQVVWNLLSNAIKFTPPGGRVEVRLERQGQEVQIQVQDSGIGIDPAFAPHLFQRFRQADSSSTRAHGGLGIGLAIVRHLVEAHGGTVSARSEGAGQGATFTVSLPASPARPRLLRPHPPPPPLAAEAPPREVPSLQGLRVLIVDDDTDTLEVVKELLEQAGAAVIAAASAAMAMQALRAGPPDVLVSDIEMPGEDGYELIRQVRQLDASQGGAIPAAALTAYTQAENRQQALQAGYQEYLSKPIEPWALAEAVARLAGRGIAGRDPTDRG